MKVEQTDDITIRFGEISSEILIDWPYENMEHELEAQALGEITKQICDAMTLQQRTEWLEEKCEIDLAKVGSEIVIKVSYPNNFDIIKIEQIKVQTEHFNSLDEIKVAFYYLKQLEENYLSEEDDCCCCC